MPMGNLNHSISHGLRNALLTVGARARFTAQTGMPKTETQTSKSLLSINSRGEYYDDGSDYPRSQALDKAERHVSCKHIEAIFSVEEV